MKTLLPLHKTAFLFVCCISLTTLKAQRHDSALFNYTGFLQKWAVPSCTSQITCYVWGAGGGQSGEGYLGSGGAGAFIAAVVDVIGIDTLGIIVGQGALYNFSYPNGTYGGGGNNSCTSSIGAGGGRSALQDSGQDILTAGGGGGAGYGYSCSYDGNGGGGGNGAIASNGIRSCWSNNCNDNGLGGTVTGGGAGGISCTDSSGNGIAGTKYQGGGVKCANSYPGGAGGGGYYGGGSGADFAGGGGGGGSSYPIAPTAYVTTIITNIPGATDCWECYSKNSTGYIYPGGYNVSPFSTYYSPPIGCSASPNYYNGFANNGYVVILYDCSTGINNLESDKIDLKVFPNPNNGLLMLSGLTGKSFIEINNVLGQKVYSQWTMNNSQLTINMGKPAPGIYVCRVLDENGNMAREVKFAVE